MLPLRARVDGLVLRGGLRHRSFLAHVERGSYEPFLRSLVEAELGPGILFVDCGAHVGLFSALAARRGARVIGVVEGESRGPKIRVFKKKRRKQYRRTKGQRSLLTRVRITDIQV